MLSSTLSINASVARTSSLQAVKANPGAIRILRIRAALTSLAIAAMLAFELCLGLSVAGRLGEGASAKADCPPAATVCLSDLLAAR
jgi:hypothetical protein